MTYVTLQTLSFAIAGVVFDRCRLIDRINSVSSEVEEEEHLADTLMQMDKSLSELSELYTESRRIEGGGVNFDDIYARAEEDYKQYCAGHKKLSNYRG